MVPMLTVLDERWDGYTASHLVRATAESAQFLAAAEHAPTVGVGHMLSALWHLPASPPPHAFAALEELGVPVEAAAAHAGSAPPQPGPPLNPPTPPTPRLRQIMAGLPSWAALTGDRRVSTVHLLAALLASSDPDVTPVHASGLTADLVLMGAARTRRRVDPDDACMAFQRLTGTEDYGFLRVAPTPSKPIGVSPEPRPPIVMRISRATLPTGGSHNTPLGMIRAARWATMYTVASGLLWMASFMLVAAAVGGTSWLLLLLPLLGMASPGWTYLPVALTAQAALVLLAPWPAAAVVAVWVAVSWLDLRNKLWMKRAELADPTFGLRRFQRDLLRAVVPSLSRTSREGNR
jgi:hypothetical protein